MSRHRFLFAGIFVLGLLAQRGLVAQSMGGGLLYTSYLPFTSLYNSLETENSITDFNNTTDGFTFDNSKILHYAPGGGISGAFAVSGTLTSVDFGLMGGAGKDNIIPDVPLRPFVSLNFAGKFVNTPVLSLYGVAGLYIDFAYAKGESSYDFWHGLFFFRLGPGISFKINPKIELFTQVQFGIGLQLESFSLKSKAGNDIYTATYLMVPIALFPELGLRFWF